MKLLKITFLLFLLATQFGYSQKNKIDFKTIHAYLEKARIQWNIPGMAVGIVKGDQLIYAQGFGVGKIGATDQVDQNTIFAIASNTKAFTSTAIGVLVEEEQLKWDDPVKKYLKDFELKDKAAAKEVTIRDMLCHRIGFPTWGGDLTWYASTNDREEVIRRMRYQEPVFDFRTSYGYCNLAFLAAGEIIPEVTKQSWDEFLKDRFFTPLEMNRTSTSIKSFVGLDNIATPHTMYQNKLVPTAYRDVDNVGPAASMNSTVNDLSKWLVMQMNDGLYKDKQIVSKEILFETHKPHNLRSVSLRSKEINPHTNFKTYGLGWEVVDYHGEKVCQHTGGMDGMLSRVSFMPEEKIGIIILTNSDENWLISFMQYYIYDQLLQKESRDWSQVYFDLYTEGKVRKAAKEKKTSSNPPAVELEELVGIYENELYGTARISQRGESLHIALSAHPNICQEISPLNGDTFLVKWNDKTWNESELHFDIEGGEVSSLRFRVRPEWIDPLEYIFEKVE